MAHSNGSKVKLSLALTALLTMQFVASQYNSSAERSGIAELSSATPTAPASDVKLATINKVIPAAIDRTNTAAVTGGTGANTGATTAATTITTTDTADTAQAAAAGSTNLRSITITETPAAEKTQIVIISKTIKICEKDQTVSVVQKDGQATYTMESECTDCDKKTGVFAAVDPKLFETKQDFESLLLPKVKTTECKVTAIEPKVDYDQQLSECAEETTKTKQRNCFINAIKNVSFEIGSDSKPYTSLSEFIETLSSSTSPITDWIENLINSRDENDIKMAKDSSAKVLAAMTKTLDNAKNFFNKKKRISSDETKELTNYKKEFKAEIGNLKLAADYKTDENALFGRTQEIAANAEVMFSKYASQTEESKSTMSQFIRNYETIANDPKYSDAQRAYIASINIENHENRDPSFGNEASVLRNWVSLINEKKKVETDLKGLQINNLKPVLAVASSDLKTDLQKSYKEVELANQKIILTDARAISDVNQINRPDVVTPHVNLFALRNDPNVGLARLGGSALNTSLPRADAIYNSNLSDMFTNSTFAPGTIGVGPIDGNSAASLGSQSVTLSSRPTGRIPAAGDAVASTLP